MVSMRGICLRSYENTRIYRTPLLWLPMLHGIDYRTRNTGHYRTMLGVIGPNLGSPMKRPIMSSKARLDIPANGNIGPTSYCSLTDSMALSAGRIAAMTLSDNSNPVTVTLDDGSQMFIGLDEHGRIELWDDCTTASYQTKGD